MARASSRLAQTAAVICAVGAGAVRQQLGRDLGPNGLLEAYDVDATLAFFDGRLRLLQDLGYVAWFADCPMENRSRSWEGDLDLEDVRCGLDASPTLTELPKAKPPRLGDLDELRKGLPMKLSFGRGGKAEGYFDRLPRAMPMVSIVYAASLRFDMRSLDFIVDSALLEALATGDFAGKDFTLQKHRSAVIIRRFDDMARLVDLRDPEFQIERLLTGRRMNDVGLPAKTVAHLQVLKIGRFRVLVFSKVDAMDVEGSVVKATAESTPNWRKMILQMVASGTTRLVRGILEETDTGLRLEQLSDYHLRDIIEWTTSVPERKWLASNLVHALAEIEETVLDPAFGDKALFSMNETGVQHSPESLGMHSPSLHALKDRSRWMLPPARVMHLLTPI